MYELCRLQSKLFSLQSLCRRWGPCCCWGGESSSWWLHLWSPWRWWQCPRVRHQWLYRYYLRHIHLPSSSWKASRRSQRPSAKPDIEDPWRKAHTLLLFVTMRPAGTRCICELYWHNITSFNNNSIHTIHAPVRFEPASTRDPTATHHLSLPGLRYKTLLTTCQTSSPVEVWHVSSSYTLLVRPFTSRWLYG
jgi:hypothetical protein